jgi:hypothetical protein
MGEVTGPQFGFSLHSQASFLAITWFWMSGPHRRASLILGHKG